MMAPRCQCRTTRTGTVTTEEHHDNSPIPDADDATAVHLEPRTPYEVQVRATNGEGDLTFETATNWSSIGRGTTGASNSRPSFDRTETLVTLTVDENTRSGQNVGSAVSATDIGRQQATG